MWYILKQALVLIFSEPYIIIGIIFGIFQNFILLISASNTTFAVNYIKTEKCRFHDEICKKDGISEAKEYLSTLSLIKNLGSLPVLCIVGILTTRVNLPLLLLISSSVIVTSLGLMTISCTDTSTLFSASYILTSIFDSCNFVIT